MFTIKKFINFNTAPGRDIKTLTSNQKSVAGICRYAGNEHSIFFIEEPTFSYVVTGYKYMIINNTEYFLNAGDLLYIPQNSIVFTHIPKQAQGFESINMILPGAAPDQTPVLRTQDPWVQQLLRTFKKRITNAALTTPEKSSVYAACVTQLAAHIKLHTLPVFNGLHTTGFEKMKTVLIDTVYTQASVAAIAGQCHMSTSTFKRKFEAAFGIPPKTWKRSICLQTAYFNLKTGSYKVSDIVDFVGFESFSHFSYAFKKQFHFSPSDSAGHTLN